MVPMASVCKCHLCLSGVCMNGFFKHLIRHYVFVCVYQHDSSSYMLLNEV